MKEKEKRVADKERRRVKGAKRRIGMSRLCTDK
jgi:hypothetical protein